MNRLLLLLPLACAACAQDAGDYPSLAIRPAERLGFAEPDPAPPTPLQADPALDTRIAQADASRVAASAAFDVASARARTLTQRARGASVGSEGWIEAQMSIAELDGLRAASMDVLVGLEDIAAERAGNLLPDYPALATAITAARNVTDRQRTEIDALAARLPTA